jgi:predicted O-methyltransferase YrrM
VSGGGPPDGPRRPGFFIPYRHAASVAAVAYPALESLFAAATPAMDEILAAIDRHAERLLGLRGPPPAPRWDQDWFPRLDGAALYTMVRLARPRRVVEVGSGHSTRFLAQAAADAGCGTSITCIDPEPRADLASLGVDLRRRLLRPADADLAAALGPGDVLFVDSSHLCVPGGDVDLVLNHLLPRLRPGVLVHFHDIFLPDAYPGAWAWRGYAEQVAVGCLLHGGGWRLRFASRYLVTRRPEALAAGAVPRLPLAAGALESSLWLERLAAAPGAAAGQPP